jgi:glycosyltransferase involved in cell wall biosynthesis
MKNKLTIIIPSRPNIQNIQWIFHSLDIQTFQDFKIILLIDTKLTKEEFENLQKESLKWLQNISDKIIFVSNINTKFIPQSGVSYVRNFWIKMADTEFTNLFDDDELFDSDYLQKTFDIWYEIKDWKAPLKKGGRGDWFVLVPTLMFRKTWQIQSQWFDYYNFWTSRPHALRLYKDQELWQIQMYSGNSLFGPTKIFQEVLFDEQLDFVYEDLEFTYRIHKAWYPIFVTSELLLYHMERDKNILEHARVWNTFAAYRKAKHRMLFIKKNWTISDKIKFYLIWFRAQPLRLSFKVMFYAKRNEKFKIIWSIIKWTLDWIKL